MCVRGREEKIFVMVWVRFFSVKEVVCGDVCDWVCIIDNIIVFEYVFFEWLLFFVVYLFGE